MFVHSKYGYGSLDRTYRSCEYGYGSLTELTQVAGRYTNVVQLTVVTVAVPAPAPGSFSKGIPVPRLLCHGRTRTELEQVPAGGTPRINTPGTVLYVPYRT